MAGTNFSPTYDKRRLAVRLGVTYNGPNIYSYGDGTNGPGGDQYLYSHLQVDLQGTYRLPKGFEAVAYGLNLTNEVFGFYNGSPVNDVQREYYRQTFGGGLRWSPHGESR
jgi:outer membrane receptor protein involved in Fe transport